MTTRTQHIKQFSRECADRLSLLQRELPMSEWPELAENAFADVILALDSDLKVLPPKAVGVLLVWLLMLAIVLVAP